MTGPTVEQAPAHQDLAAGPSISSATAATGDDTQGTSGADTHPHTVTGPTLRSTARRARGPLLFLAALVVVGSVVGLLSNGGGGSRLDPDSYAGTGARAIAEVLNAQGVTVTRVDTIDGVTRAADQGATVLVPQPAGLATSELEQLRRVPGRLLLLGADDPQLTTLDVGAAVLGQAGVDPRSPGCRLPEAERAGTVALGGLTYTVDTDAQPAALTQDMPRRAVGCYLVDGDPTLLVLFQRAGAPGETVLLGSGELFSNDKIDEDGNASLALGLLGSADELVWFVPRPGRPLPPGERGSLTALLPPGLPLGVLQLTIALGLLALWRARRLGRVVEEPLPVVIRAAEAVEGRSRLYRASGARAPAAEALRAATRERLARRVGMGPAPAPQALVEALHERVGGQASQVAALLYGVAPGDDDALVHLARGLRALETQVSEGANGA